jgi:hypothetical protein
MIPVAVGLFACASTLCAVFSEGFLTADALTHFLYAKYAFRRPTYLVDVWGRPFVTALYAVPAALGGRVGVRLASLAVALACAAVAGRLARGQGIRRPALAVVFTLAQPLVFLNSFAEMTELPFALLAGAALWAYQARRLWVAAALVALTPLARPEGFGLVLLAAAGFALQKRWWPLLLLPVPLLLWNHAGWELYGRHGPWWRWLADNWPYSRESAYPPGSLLQFVATLPVVVSPFALPAVLLGTFLSLAQARRVETEDAATSHLRQCVVLTAAIPLSILLVHSLLYRLGKMASYGEPRYLLVAAPMWAVLAARGWEWAFERFGWRHPLRWAAAAAVAPALALVAHPVLPLRTPDHWQVARAFANEYRRAPVFRGYPRVLVAHPAVFYYLGVDPQDASATAEWHKATVASPPAGTVLVWDPIYAARNAHGDRSVTLDDVRRGGWLPDPVMDDVLTSAASQKQRRPAPDPEAVLSTGEGWHVFRSPAPASR